MTNLSTVIALALIAFAANSALAQEIDCSEEFFRVGRLESCQDFFVCMIGGRIDFSCDDGDIFDEDNVSCRPGDADTCEFHPEITTTVIPDSSTVTGTVAPPANSFRLDAFSVSSKYARNVEIIGDECENDFLRIAPHPDPELCFHFFVCMNYNLVQFECDLGYIFSAEGERCIPGSHESCEEDGLTPFKKAMGIMKSLRKQ